MGTQEELEQARGQVPETVLENDLHTEIEHAICKAGERGVNGDEGGHELRRRRKCAEKD